MQFDTKSLWIYLYFPKLQLNQLEQQNIEFKDTLPRVIYDVKANRLLQLNAQALDKGLKEGMGLATASLLTTELQVHEYDIKTEKKALTKITHGLYFVTSDIALDPPKGLYLRAQNMLSLYGGLSSYWHTISNVLASTNLEFYFASGFSASTAKLLALHKLNKINDNRNLIDKWLRQCLLSKTDIDKKDLEKLTRIGVNNVDSLLQFPLSELASRLSRFSLNIISNLKGESPAKLSFYSPPEYYDDSIELIYDIEFIDKLLPIINTLMEKFEQFLLVRDSLSLQIDITLHQRDAPIINQTIRSAIPIYRSSDWMSLIELNFEKLRLSSPVHAISFTCNELEITDVSNNDLFINKTTHVAKLTLISRLKAKLGNEQVKSLTFVQDFRPEKTVKTISLYSKAFNSQSERINKDKYLEDRPGFLLEEPQILREKVTILHGPERIVSGWWDNQKVHRDYYIAQNQHGQQLWVYKTPNQSWYLHGYFI